MLQAACHCGAVQLEISQKPETLTECTLSVEVRRRPGKSRPRSATSPIPLESASPRA